MQEKMEIIDSQIRKDSVNLYNDESETKENENDDNEDETEDYSAIAQLEPSITAMESDIESQQTSNVHLALTTDTHSRQNSDTGTLLSATSAASAASAGSAASGTSVATRITNLTMISTETTETMDTTDTNTTNTTNITNDTKATTANSNTNCNSNSNSDPNSNENENVSLIDGESDAQITKTQSLGVGAPIGSSNRRSKRRGHHKKAQSLFGTQSDINSSLSSIHTLTTTATSATDGSASSSRNGTVLVVPDETIKEKFELYHLFDEAEKEVWRLMKDCLVRFQQSKEYERLAIQTALKHRFKSNDMTHNNSDYNLHHHHHHGDNDRHNNNSNGSSRSSMNVVGDNSSLVSSSNALSRMASLFKNMKVTMSMSVNQTQSNTQQNNGTMKEPLLHS